MNMKITRTIMLMAVVTVGLIAGCSVAAPQHHAAPAVTKTVTAPATTHAAAPSATKTVTVPATAHAAAPAASKTVSAPATTHAATVTPQATHAAKPRPAASVVLVNLSGSGIKNSAPFTVSSGTLTVSYSYNCASFGGRGNFVADLLSGNQSSLNSDDQSIANALGSSGAATTHIYPTMVGSKYYLSVNSECSWTVIVKSP
jgi:hypothetical protein